MALWKRLGMVMRRWEFVVVLMVATAVPFAAVAKEPSRIAVLGSSSEETAMSVNQMAWLRKGLYAVGLVEGKDFIFDARWANGEYKQFPALAADVIARQPSAIVVSTIAAAEAARELSKTIPIVMTGLNDPVGVGLVSSLARPGGNITGMATMNEEVILKVMGFVPSVLPKAKSVMAIRNPSNPSSGVMLDAILIQAARLGFRVTTAEVPTPAALDYAFAEIRRQHPDVLLIIPDNALAALSKQIISTALLQGIPTIGISREVAESGGIVSYGFSRRESMERTGSYIKKLLAGANAGDLPVEQPTKFEMIVNLRSARLLGIEIPTAQLVQADEIIE